MDFRTVTVMVIDLVDSTTAISAVPGAKMIQLMEDSAGPIRPLAERLGGTVIKFTGDGYLITFPSATSALHAATQIAELFAARSPLTDGIKGCRIALHTCDVIPYETDVLGEGVVVAARMEKYVPVNAVYVTATVRNVAKSGEFTFVRAEELTLAGLSEPVTTYRLVTESYRGVERNTFLTVTDLVGLNDRAAELALTDLNRILQEWVGMHRGALSESQGRLRAVAGDNVISTHPSADDAVDFVVRLRSLIDGYNESHPPGEYLLRHSAFTGHGDLFVPDFGVAGPLVTGTFRHLAAITPGTAAVADEVFHALTRNAELFGDDCRQIPGRPGAQRMHVLRHPG